jgi:hypothetical protein
VADLLRFPNPVNELAARTVAAGVVLMALATLILGIAVGSDWLGLSAVIAAGFLARVASGPTFSPLGQLATRVIAPRLGPAKFVAGPPKRFAQALGAVMSTAAVISHFVFGLETLTEVLLGLIVVAATLESAFAICLGCIVFARLMSAGLVPADTCEACANVSLRYSNAA